MSTKIWKMVHSSRMDGLNETYEFYEEYLDMSYQQEHITMLETEVGEQICYNTAKNL